MSIGLIKCFQRKKRYYGKFLNKIKLNERLVDIIKLVKPEYKVALVTTASRKNTMEALDSKRIREYFDLILTAEDVERPKPDPDGFLRAAKYFGAMSDEVMVFEDSELGVAAAEAASMQVCKVINFV